MHSKVVEDIIKKQPKPVQAAIRELEERGLSFCVHFGYDTAIAVKAALDKAFREGRLYEHLAKFHGIV